MNEERLREVMREKGITVVKMCREIGISRKAFWSKCTGRTEFTQSEIAKIVELVGKREGMNIFFPSSVVNDTTSKDECHDA